MTFDQLNWERQQSRDMARFNHELHGGKMTATDADIAARYGLNLRDSREPSAPLCAGGQGRDDAEAESDGEALVIAVLICIVAGLAGAAIGFAYYGHRWLCGVAAVLAISVWSMLMSLPREDEP